MPDAMTNDAVCPKCSTEFTPKRTNQIYCARTCQKAATRHTARGNRSRENTDRSLRHFERSQRLFEMIFTTPPSDRLGTMQYILSFIPVDSGLRNILTDPGLLSERPRVDGRKNIAKAADAYTKKFYGVSISTYVRKARTGAELEGVPVTATEVVQPIPKLRPVLTKDNVRCIHKPLASGPLEVIRKMREVAGASRSDNPDVADSLTLLADVRQAGVVTDKDYERIDAIVNQSLKALDKAA